MRISDWSSDVCSSDLENCADMALEVADVDPGYIRSAGAVLINGTHLSRPNVFDASVHACTIAREAGAKVVFDIDYRPVLWGMAGKDMGETRFVADAAVPAPPQLESGRGARRGRGRLQR